MKLYIKRDKCADNRMFTIFDEFCNEKYYVTGTKDKLSLMNLNKEYMMSVRRAPLPALMAYSITAGKTNIKFILGKPNSKVQCYYYGISWRIRGNVFIKSFDIMDADNSIVATHVKRFSPCGDGYELNVLNEKMELFCIATSLCINLSAKVDNPMYQTV